MPPRRTLVESLLLGLPERPSSSDACWLWQGAQNGRGYGQIRRGTTSVSAHRVAYEHFVGPIPDGMLIRHSCHTPRCCNPLHLSTGTHADNSDDMLLADRSNRGERHGMVKLDEETVKAIRSRYRHGLGRALADEYGVSRETITNIAGRRSWKYL